MEDSVVYNIEQNKYSSRKIVLRKEMPDDKTKLEQIISSKIIWFKRKYGIGWRCYYFYRAHFFAGGFATFLYLFAYLLIGL